MRRVGGEGCSRAAGGLRLGRGRTRRTEDKKPVTEFMIFTREFYVAHRPTFRLTENEMASSEYQRYLASCPHRHDSGVGYGFKVWSQGLSWFPLKLVDRDREPDSTGALYENLIFHLDGTVRNRSARENVFSSKTRIVARLLSLIRVLGKAIVPSNLWRRLNRMDAIQRWAGAHGRGRCAGAHSWRPGRHSWPTRTVPAPAPGSPRRRDEVTKESKSGTIA